MKKLFAIAMALVLTLSFAACTGEDSTDTTANKDTVTAADTTKAETSAPSTQVPALEGTTYEQFLAAEMDSKIENVVTYVQAKQGWWEKDGQGCATIYTQNADGAYFLYEVNCSKEDYDKMVTGTKIKVAGFKTAYAGELELTGVTYEILEGDKYIAVAQDISAVAEADLEKHMNKLIALKGMTVVASKDENDADVPFTYKSTQGDDLYFKASVNGITYSFCVESYLTGSDTEVYKAVEALKIGDKIDVEAFLYWYNGANPHVVSVKASPEASPVVTEGETTDGPATTAKYYKPDEIMPAVLAEDSMSIKIAADSDELLIEKDGNIARLTVDGNYNYLDIASGKLYAPTKDGKWVHINTTITYTWETYLSLVAQISASMYYFDTQYYEDFTDSDTLLTYKSLTLSVVSPAESLTLERSADVYTITEKYKDRTVKCIFDFSAEPDLTLPVVG